MPPSITKVLETIAKSLESPWTLIVVAGAVWALTAVVDPAGLIAPYYYYRGDRLRYSVYHYSLLFIKIAGLWTLIGLARSHFSH